MPFEPNWMHCLIGSALSFVFAFTAHHWVCRRRFNRRNPHGVEIFRSYGHQWRARSAEQSVGCLAALAFFFALALILAAAGAYLSKHS